MNIPGNLKYTSEHEWISVEGDVASGWNYLIRSGGIR